MSGFKENIDRLSMGSGSPHEVNSITAAENLVDQRIKRILQYLEIDRNSTTSESRDRMRRKLDELMELS